MTKSTKQKSNNYMGYIIFAALILIFLNFSDSIWNNTNTSTKTETTRNSYSPDGNNCAIIKTDKPYSYPVSLCRNEYRSESAWKATIKKIAKAKKHDEHGNGFDVTIKYE